MTELIIGLLLGFAIHYALYNYADESDDVYRSLVNVC